MAGSCAPKDGYDKTMRLMFADTLKDVAAEIETVSDNEFHGILAMVFNRGWLLPQMLASRMSLSKVPREWRFLDPAFRITPDLATRQKALVAVYELLEEGCLPPPALRSVSPQVQ